MTVQDIVRAGYPNATDEETEYVIWNRTSYPFKGLTAKMVYKAASQTYRASKKGLQLCDFCDNIATECGICSKCTMLFKAVK